MLKEVGKGVEKIFDNSDGMDRKTLIETLEKHLQRNKTINILEGRDRKRRKSGKGKQGFEDSDVTDEENETKPSNGSIRRRQNSTSKGRNKSSKSIRASEAQNGHMSQFMDADDAEAQEQIEQQLAAGISVVGSIFLSLCISKIHIRLSSSPPVPRQVLEA
jgi:cytokinesis protein